MFDKTAALWRRWILPFGATTALGCVYVAPMTFPKQDHSLMKGSA